MYDLHVKTILLLVVHLNNKIIYWVIHAGYENIDDADKYHFQETSISHCLSFAYSTISMLHNINPKNSQPFCL